MVNDECSKQQAIVLHGNPECCSIASYPKVKWIERWDRSLNVSPIQSQRWPEPGFCRHFRWKPKTVSFWKSCGNGKSKLKTTTAYNSSRNQLVRTEWSPLWLYFSEIMNSYIYITVTACKNIFVVTAYSLKLCLRKFKGQRVKLWKTAKLCVSQVDCAVIVFRTQVSAFSIFPFQAITKTW